MRVVEIQEQPAALLQVAELRHGCSPAHAVRAIRNVGDDLPLPAHVFDEVEVVVPAGQHLADRRGLGSTHRASRCLAPGRSVEAAGRGGGARSRSTHLTGAIRRWNVVSKPNFVVPLADLERGPHSVTWPIPVSWLEAALRGIEATPAGEPGVLSVNLSRNGSDVLVRGHAEVSVKMPCVVTLEPLLFTVRPQISLLLAPAASVSPKAPASSGRRVKNPGTLDRRPRKFGREAAESWQEAPELSLMDAARDTFEADRIELDEFLREFILLELPLYPRRSDLPSDQADATNSPPAPSTSAEAGSSPRPLDPRLAPLAELRDRLRQDKKE